MDEELTTAGCHIPGDDPGEVTTADHAGSVAEILQWYEVEKEHMSMERRVEVEGFVARIRARSAEFLGAQERFVEIEREIRRKEQEWGFGDA